ncbi:ClC family H(+)/Cl(-) exchange transporter [Pediococcus claussenii]|uniref:Voltage gated chloride channel family protein n=1 Tax=Pediococcus claussenii (strain ATCC BAA-344 / DSM 14800 / JCM 18046 / KCTC 3811 / LMG 21948 / P06) TaxID=701521 RepID=G8PAE3_PEDCP|nr:ClC family H(+)/Cl(-) exchange transporter [Pediococcus claussenii]AEV95732.1 voltage gated chloride channel family protein [Pediococcus claussenii ATCC BAA-344]ANZ69241.1 ClC family H(+)/Cl(-) exchange transporter [Pediococcus claussenii]ANZ71060.1 ClC family H(+)/Cl(-) exchange transporter [Pediococcus claussenii]KRN20033.1 hypothetical protein IV79_GL000696 [Pediococcus claussenii]
MQSKFQNTRFLALVHAIIIGTLIGLVVSCFRLAIEKMLTIFTSLYQQASSHLLILGLIIVLNVLIALIVSMWVKQTPAISGSGIPQVEGQLAGEYDSKWFPVLWKKTIGGILAIGSGLMLGREGPSIQLGAAIGQGWSDFRHFEGSDKRVLIASGSAAGLSAAFNAPIASTLFVLEEIYHNFSPLVWISALTSAVMSNFISLNFFGLKPVLAIRYAHALPLSMYWQLLVLGILLGLAGRFYQIVLLQLTKWYAAISFLPRWMDGLVPLLVVIPLGLFSPHILGGGNSLVPQIAQQSHLLLPIISLLVIRFVFSMISYGSGLPGGIFLPILTLGAIIGALYVTVMAQLNLINPVYLPNFVIYAMAGYFACIGKAPFTAILLVTEMVGSLQHLMPLAVVSLTAYIIVDLLGGEPIYESLLHQLVPELIQNPSGLQDHIEFPIFEGSDLDGITVREVKWPENSLLIAIRRGKREIIPNGDSILKTGDTLIVSTQRSNRAFVKQHLTNLY